MIKTSPKHQPRSREGLREIVREVAERHDADVILQALTVACGANAIGVESPCEPPSQKAAP